MDRTSRRPDGYRRDQPPVKNYTEHGDFEAPSRPHEEDDDSHTRPPDYDDLSDFLPIAERG